MIHSLPPLPAELPRTEADIPDELMPEEDGVPMETQWHRDEMNLLIGVLFWHFRDRQDFYVGGNQFIYYSLEQVLNRDFLGPDFYFVNDVSRTPMRSRWIVWREGGRFPNVIVELLSSSTAEQDRTTKKDIYERIFRTPEYFCYDPDAGLLEGWRLLNESYQALDMDERGWMWSEQLQLWLGPWQGQLHGYESIWLRFYEKDGQLVLMAAEAERLRADALEAELVKLRARLAEQGRNGGAS